MGPQPQGCTDSNATEVTEQHTWDECQDLTYSSSFYFLFFPILSLITYLVLLLFKKQCLLSNFNVVIC